MGAIILAGGSSTRFGANKLLARVNGTPVLARVFRAVSQIESPVVVSVHSRSQGTELLAVLPRRTPLVIDRRSTTAFGPGVGIVSGLLSLPPGPTLIVGGDMPWISPSSLRSLQEIVRLNGWAAGAPLTERGWVEPLVQAHIRRPPKTTLRRLLDLRGPFLRPTDLLRGLAGVGLAPAAGLTDDTRCFRSLNRPNELGISKSRLQTRVPGADALTVPENASRAFWAATDHVRDEELLLAAELYMDEAGTYRELGVALLELHCLKDAVACLRRVSAAHGATETRIRQLELENDYRVAPDNRPPRERGSPTQIIPGAL